MFTCSVERIVYIMYCCVCELCEYTVSVCRQRTVRKKIQCAYQIFDLKNVTSMRYLKITFKCVSKKNPKQVQTHILRYLLRLNHLELLNLRLLILLQMLHCYILILHFKRLLELLLQKLCMHWIRGCHWRL